MRKRLGQLVAGRAGSPARAETANNHTCLCRLEIRVGWPYRVPGPPLDRVGMKPSDLPVVREGMTRWVRTQTPGPYGAANAALLDSARLYWVTAQMRAEAAEFARHEIYESRWTEDDRPAPCGIMLVENGLGNVPFWRRGRLIRATAVAWSPVREGLALTFWSPRDQVVRLLGTTPQRRFPPLVMVASVQQPVERDYRPTSDLAPIWRAPVALLQAAWLLMASPLTTSSTLSQEPTQALSTSQHRHSAYRDPAVTIIHIRQPAADPDATSDGHVQRHYGHRWRVRPHKRWVHCGPDHADLRRVPVRGHVKGPPGAPWVHHTQVTIWDR